jgi:hypothetical protein
VRSTCACILALAEQRDPGRSSPLLIARQLVPVGEVVLYAPLPTPTAWQLASPPSPPLIWGGYVLGLRLRLVNALIGSSLNRQLYELPAPSSQPPLTESLPRGRSQRQGPPFFWPTRQAQRLAGGNKALDELEANPQLIVL